MREGCFCIAIPAFMLGMGAAILFMPQVDNSGSAPRRMGRKLETGVNFPITSRVSIPASASRLEVPPNREELGRATWTLLHTLAANYAETPSSHTRASALALMNALGELYPCAECASHLRRQMARTPVTVDSRSALALWLCEAHNKVEAV